MASGRHDHSTDMWEEEEDSFAYTSVFVVLSIKTSSVVDIALSINQYHRVSACCNVVVSEHCVNTNWPLYMCCCSAPVCWNLTLIYSFRGKKHPLDVT